MSVGPQIEGQNGGAVAVQYVPSPLSTCLLQEGPLFSLLHGPSNLSLWSPHLETPSHGVSSERLQAPASQLPPKASLPTQPLLPSPPTLYNLGLGWSHCDSILKAPRCLPRRLVSSFQSTPQHSNAALLSPVGLFPSHTPTPLLGDRAPFLSLRSRHLKSSCCHLSSRLANACTSQPTFLTFPQAILEVSGHLFTHTGPPPHFWVSAVSPHPPRTG